jgi:hypothetical protein
MNLYPEFAAMKTKLATVGSDKVPQGSGKGQRWRKFLPPAYACTERG